MSELYEKYLGQQEVVVFYVFFLLGSVQVGCDKVVFEKGVGIVQSIIWENLAYLGVLYYLIYFYDDLGYVCLVFDVANSYVKVVFDVVYVLYMLFYIYVVMGMWDEVVNLNIVFYDVSVQCMKVKELDNDVWSYYVFYWLQYGYL